VPDLQLTSLSLRLLTETEVRQVLRCMQRDHEFQEWETVGFTFLLCTRGPHTNLGRGPAIIRAGAFGGDVRDVHGGWLYLTEMHARKEWREIGEVAKAYRRK